MWRRVRANWRLLLVLFAGILLATTVLSGAPLFLTSVKELGLRHALRYERAGVLDTAITVQNRPLDPSGFAQADAKITSRTDETVRLFVEEQFTHIRTPGMQLTRPGGPAQATQFRASLQSFAGYEEHSRLVEGAYPAGARGQDIEVAVGRASAQRFSLKVGDRIAATPEGGRTVTAVVSGILEITDPESAYWGFPVDPFSPQIDYSPNGEEIPMLPMLVSQDHYLGVVASRYPGMRVDYWWYLLLDPGRLKASTIDGAREGITELERNVPLDFPGSQVFSGLGETLHDYENKIFFSRIPILVMLLLVVAVTLYFIIMVADIVVERQLGEIALFRSRGADTGQMMGVYLLEALALCAAAFLLGPPLALILVPLFGKTPAFSDVNGGALLPVDLTPLVILTSLLGAALCFIALTFPALRGARFNLLNVRAAMARPARLLLFHRYYLDLFLLALAGFAYWELTQRGSLVTTRLFGDDSVSKLLLIAPLLMMLSFSLLILRAVPLLLRLAGAGASFTTRTWLALGLWNLSRNPVQYLRPALLLMLVAAMAVFAASYNQTVQSSYRDRGLYTSGSDARLVNIPRYASGSTESLEAEFDRRPAVELARAAYRFDPDSFGGDVRTSYPLLLVDSIKFDQVTWFRDDFSEQDLFALLRKLDTGRAILRGKDLPPNTTGLGIWVKPSQPYQNMSLWARIRDADGSPWRFRLGRLDFSEWQFMQADFTTFFGDRPKGPLTLLSLYIWELDFPQEPFPLDQLATGYTSSGQINFSGLTAKLPNGQETLVDRLDRREGWSPMATNALLPEAVESSTRVQLLTRPTLEFSWKPTSGVGLRGIYPSDLREPLPIIASGAFLGITGKRVGDVLDVNVAGVPMPVKIADKLDFFPTMDPARPFIIGNLETMLHYANLFRGMNLAFPNEVWLRLNNDADDREAFHESLRRDGWDAFLVLDRGTQLEQLNKDPLVGAASEGVVFTVLLILVVIAIGGYAGYAYVGSHRLPLEHAVLRALGVSQRGLVAFQLFVHGVIVFSAVLLGAIVGARAHGTMVTFLNHTTEGREVQLPFARVTDWSGLGVVLLASAAAMAAVVTWTAVQHGRAPIWRMLRRGEG
jgi:hypothetical protein